MSDTTKIIVSQILTTTGAMVVAIIVFQLNKNRERNLIRDNLKVKIGGICDRVMRHSGAFEISRVHHYFNSRLSELAQIQTAKDSLNKTADDFLSRTNDSSHALFLTKSELVEAVSHLFLYLEDVNEKTRLKALLMLIHNYKFPDENDVAKRYRDSNNIIELSSINEEDKENITNPKEATLMQRACKEIQEMVNPIFYK
jgi:hypothetical protein